jgi:hypothetical protein
MRIATSSTLATCSDVMTIVKWLGSIPVSITVQFVGILYNSQEIDDLYQESVQGHMAKKQKDNHDTGNDRI